MNDNADIENHKGRKINECVHYLIYMKNREIAVSPLHHLYLEVCDNIRLYISNTLDPSLQWLINQ